MTDRLIPFAALVFATYVCLLSPFPSEARVRKCFYVSDYGTESEALARLVYEVNKNKGGRVIFPQNETIVVSIKDDPNGGHKLIPQTTSIPFAFKNCKFLEIDLNGSTIVLQKNHSTKYALFYFFECKKISLRNGALVGDAKTHDYTPVTFLGTRENSSHEWGHGIMLLGSKGVITDVNISYMTGDGIYVASRKENNMVYEAQVEIKNCDIGFVRRNGISCASNKGFSLINSKIHDIGAFDNVEGTDPRSGIDFEYEDGVGCQGKIAIFGCSFWNCERKTVTTSNVFVPNVLSLKIDFCFFSGSYFQISNMVASKGKHITHCSFEGAPINSGNAVYEDCDFFMGPKLYYVHGTHFKHCRFTGTTENLTGPYGCAIAGNSLDAAIFEDCSFKDIRGLNNSSPAYQGFSAYNFSLNSSFIRCTFQNISFVKGNPKHESCFSFLDCTLSDGCMIYNEGGSAILFKKSKVDNVDSYPNQRGNFIFEECEIIQTDDTVANPLLYFGTHRIRGCKVNNTLSITPIMRSKGVSAIIIK